MAGLNVKERPELFKTGMAVNFFSMAGPCLPATLVKINQTRCKLDFYGGRQDEPKWSVHIVGSCPSCMTHPQTQYPHGYMD